MKTACSDVLPAVSHDAAMAVSGVHKKWVLTPPTGLSPAGGQEAAALATVPSL